MSEAGSKDKGAETGTIQSVSRESRTFPPPASFTAAAPICRVRKACRRT